MAKAEEKVFLDIRDLSQQVKTVIGSNDRPNDLNSVDYFRLQVQIQLAIAQQLAVISGHLREWTDVAKAMVEAKEK